MERTAALCRDVQATPVRLGLIPTRAVVTLQRVPQYTTEDLGNGPAKLHGRRGRSTALGYTDNVALLDGACSLSAGAVKDDMFAITVIMGLPFEMPLVPKA